MSTKQGSSGCLLSIMSQIEKEETSNIPPMLMNRKRLTSHSGTLHSGEQKVFGVNWNVDNDQSWRDCQKSWAYQAKYRQSGGQVLWLFNDPLGILAPVVMFKMKMCEVIQVTHMTNLLLGHINFATVPLTFRKRSIWLLQVGKTFEVDSECSKILQRQHHLP